MKPSYPCLFLTRSFLSLSIFWSPTKPPTYTDKAIVLQFPNPFISSLPEYLLYHFRAEHHNLITNTLARKFCKLLFSPNHHNVISLEFDRSLTGKIDISLVTSIVITNSSSNFWISGLKTQKSPRGYGKPDTVQDILSERIKFIDNEFEVRDDDGQHADYDFRLLIQTDFRNGHVDLWQCIVSERWCRFEFRLEQNWIENNARLL